MTLHCFVRRLCVAVLLLWAFGLGEVKGQGGGQAWPPSPSDKVVNISGVHPHLTVFNSSGECGIGAVVPHAGKLWFLTYPPHAPEGSDDKLYALDEDLKLEMRKESVGGTHANRFLHSPSRQLIIGPYFINEEGDVRVADIHQLRGRLTATTPHLTDPKHKVYFLGMERELYAVDVESLAVERIYGEGGGPFPGSHGKGAYISQGRLLVANNGERGWSISKDPSFLGPSGCLAESTGTDWQQPWTVDERKSFCEITGPGGLSGNVAYDDRVWATGWDKRSVILKLFEDAKWRTFRLPKASYTHDALNGWYTEWPRIRELGSGTTMMHMHGMFYFFPKNFSLADNGGLRPISTYLSMPVDYCWWRGEIVIARDDVSVMQNDLAGQSHSTLWFGQFDDLARYGPPTGWGGPWINDAVPAGQPSEPFLVSEFERGVLHLRQADPETNAITIEADDSGRGMWRKVASVDVSPRGYAYWTFPPGFKATWVRLTAERAAQNLTAYFHLGNPPARADQELFRGLADARAEENVCDGLIKPGQGDARRLLFAANRIEGKSAERAFYEMDGQLVLKQTEKTEDVLTHPLEAPFTVDAASVIVVEGTNRFRLPKSLSVYDQAGSTGWPRGKREVVTERSLLNAHGTFYELPRADAGGLRRIRPITTHNKRISDFCRWRGLLVLAGTSSDALATEHLYASSGASLWFGDVDDLWRLGPPRGVGGPWKDTSIEANTPSDPYLMTGYDRKRLSLSHDSKEPMRFTVEVDFLADGSWAEYGNHTVQQNEEFKHEFPQGYSAHWVRLRADRATKATAIFTYQ